MIINSANWRGKKQGRGKKEKPRLSGSKHTQQYFICKECLR